MISIIPRDHVGYYIQSIEFGTCLSVIDNVLVGETQRSANLVARYRKEGTKTQEWVFHSRGNDSWIIENRGAPFYIANSGTCKVSFSNSHNSIPSSESWTVERIPETEGTFTIQNDHGLLHLVSPTNLEIGPVDDKDNSHWRLLEVCPIFGRVDYAYRLRNLNNLILAVDSNGKYTAENQNEALIADRQTLWVVTPVAEGQCALKILDGGPEDHLCPTSEDATSQANWVAKGAEYLWNLESIRPGLWSRPFMYAIVKTRNQTDFAITVENDKDIVLQPHKNDHGQLWFFEPMDHGEVEEEKQRISLIKEEERRRIAEIEEEKRRIAQLEEETRRRRIAQLPTFYPGSPYRIQNISTSRVMILWAGYNLLGSVSISSPRYPQHRTFILKTQVDGGVAFCSIHEGKWATPFGPTDSEHGFGFIASPTTKENFSICENHLSRRAFYDPGTPGDTRFDSYLELRDLNPNDSRQIWRLISG